MRKVPERIAVTFSLNPLRPAIVIRQYKYYYFGNRFAFHYFGNRISCQCIVWQAVRAEEQNTQLPAPRGPQGSHVI